MTLYHIVLIKVASAQLRPSEPPRHSGVGDRGGDACELDRPLVPGPLLVVELVLEGGRELNGDVARLVEPPALVLGLALVQAVVRSLYPVDRDC